MRACRCRSDVAGAGFAPQGRPKARIRPHWGQRSREAASVGVHFVTAKVLMYSTAVCPYCVRAETYLRTKGITEIDKIRVDLDPARRVEMMQRTGRRTVPQIYIDERHVGGYEDLVALDRAGGLAPLLG
jgi:glutaredoxin 3